MEYNFYFFNVKDPKGFPIGMLMAGKPLGSFFTPRPGVGVAV